jgi:pentatricopeptide repeat protein
MHSDGVTPDVVLCNAAIDAYVRAGDLDRARDIVGCMARASSPSSRASLGHSPSALSVSLADDPEMMMTMDELMDRAGAAVTPNIKTYNTLLKGFARQCRSRSSPDQMDQLDPSASGRPTEAAIAYDGERGEAGEGQEASEDGVRTALDNLFVLRAEMLTFGVVADSISEATTIDACVRAGQMGKAREVLRNATIAPLAPAPTAESAADRATRATGKVSRSPRRSARARVGVEGYTALLSGHVARGELNEAVDIFREVGRH